MKVAPGRGMNKRLIAAEQRAVGAGWKSSHADRIFDLSATPEFPEPA